MVYRKSRRTSSRRSYRSRASGAYKKTGLSLSMPFLIGAAVGLSNLDNKIPKDLTLVAATAPIRGFGSIKAAAQGVILGNVVQHFTGFRTGSTPGYKNMFTGF